MNRRTRRVLSVTIVSVTILCIFAAILTLFSQEDGEAKKAESASQEEIGGITIEEVEDTEPTSEGESVEEEEETEVAEQETEEIIYEQAELPEVREGIEVYCTVNENPVWDIQIYASEEEAKNSAYTIQETGEKKFCISGFESAIQVTSTIKGTDGSELPLTYEYFAEEGVYSFGADFAGDTYIAEISYIVDDVQDTVYLGLDFQ